MALAFIEDWLGCLDPQMSICIWQIALELSITNVPLISPDVVFEAYTPDDYCARPAMMLATIEILALTLVLNDENPCEPFAFIVGDFANWMASVPYILTFAPDLSDAPCTQQIFP